MSMFSKAADVRINGGFFTNANNIVISGGNFNSIRGDQVNYHYTGEVEGRKGQQLMDI